IQAAMPFPKINPDQEQELESKKSSEPRAGARASPSLPDMSAEVVSDQVFAEAQEALQKCLRAERPVWDKDSKSFRMEPDYPTIMAAVKVSLEYKIGRPVERRIEIRANTDTWEDQKQRHLESAEGIRFLLAAGAISREQADHALGKLAKNLSSTLG
ncbi:MAG: hypothetical protein WCF18_04425, partial [Chthoniobacteraceae bacterium]